MTKIYSSIEAFIKTHQGYEVQETGKTKKNRRVYKAIKKSLNFKIIAFFATLFSLGFGLASKRVRNWWKGKNITKFILNNNYKKHAEFSLLNKSQNIARKNLAKVKEESHSFETNFPKKNINKLQKFEDLVKKRGLFVVYDIVYNPSILGYNQLNIQDKLQLANTIAKQGDEAAYPLAENFKKLALKDAKVEERLKLANTIAKQGDKAALALAKNFEKLALQDAKVEERLKLTNTIAQQGYVAARALAENFEKLALKDAKVEERLKLANTIAKQGDFAAQALAKNVEKLVLKDAKIEERLKLANTIANQGDEAAQTLAENLEKLAPKDAKIEERLKLANTIARIFSSFSEIPIKQLVKLFKSPDENKQIQQLIMKLTFLYHEKIDTTEINQKYIQNISSILKIISVKSDNINWSVPLPEYILENIKEVKNFLLENKKFEEINKIHQEIKSKYQKNPSLYFELLQWIAYTAGFIQLENLNHLSFVNKSNLLQTIYKHRNLKDRFILTNKLFSTLSQHPSDFKNMPQQKLEKYIPKIELKKKSIKAKLKKLNKDLGDKEIQEKVSKEVNKLIKLRPHGKLSWILLSRLTNLGIKREDALEILYLINSKTKLKDTKRIHDVIQFLFNLTQFFFNEKEAQLITDHLKAAFREKSINSITRKIQQLNNILTLFGRNVFFESIENSDDYNQIFLDNFNQLFSLKLKDPKKLTENYQRTFVQFRDNKALFTYLQSVNKLPVNDKEMVKAVLDQYVSFVLNGNFQERRYDSDNNPHLTKIFGYKDDLKKLWTESLNEKNVEREKEKEKELNFIEFFYQKIITDKHLDHNKFPELVRFLKEEKIDLKQLQTKEKSDTVSFQFLTIQLCKKEISKEEFIKKLSQLKLNLGELQNDINTLKSKEKVGNLIISETDDPCDLLLIGTEIQGSCQRVNGTPNLNKCLAGYLLNGEVRLIVVRNTYTKRLVARSLLRLMWDDENKTPVLLQERIYSNTKDQSLNIHLIDWAKAKAKKMGIPLVSVEVGQGVAYNGSVTFLGGGRAPYIYSDAFSGVMNTSKKFSTKRVHVLYKTGNSSK